MRTTLILATLAVLGLAGLWLFAGRQIVQLVEVYATGPAEALPAGPYVYSPNGIAIGEYPNWTELPDGQPAALRVDVDASGRLVLHAQGRAFPLGTRIGPPDLSGRPDIPFAPDPGDEVGFSRALGLVAWPTPFDMNFMTGHSATWRRNLYFRLAWRKADGRRLDMVWRYQQLYYGQDGWSSSWMTQDGATGLVRFDLVAPPGDEPESIRAYLERVRGWTEAEYRLDKSGPSSDGCYDVVRVVHRSDEAAARPGGGGSVELYLDRGTRLISKEIGLQ